MSIQSTIDPLTRRRDRRVTSHCDIWDMLAPDVPCPACNTGFADRLERALGERAERDDAGSAASRDEARQLVGFLAR